jgi:hypothetical protein
MGSTFEDGANLHNCILLHRSVDDAGQMQGIDNPKDLECNFLANEGEVVHLCVIAPLRTSVVRERVPSLDVEKS